MEQKRVSFAVAKAIKEAGYPQNYSFNISVYDKEGKEVAIGDADIPLNCEAILAPAYLDVWTWLWRKKEIKILFDEDYVEIPGYSYCEFQKDYVDPEEAIIRAIKYLVENNLIK